jgi:inosose dehydratase
MSEIQVGNAPCSWGTLEFEDLEGDTVGYEQMLDELAETGYTGTELGDWGFMPTRPEGLQRALSKDNLTLLGAFVPVALKFEESHEKGTEEAVKVASLMSAVANSRHAPFLVLADENGEDPVRTRNAGRVEPGMGLKEPEWEVFAKGAQRVALAVREETGLPTVFHHHCGGFVETPNEIARLMDLTDPELLGLVFDTGHYAFGTGDPEEQSVVEGMERFADRIWYVHFKDCDAGVAAKIRANKADYFSAVRNGVFCELGQGCVDFPGALDWLRGRGYSGWITVEQDVLPGMGTPKESAARNREYLRGIGL